MSNEELGTKLGDLNAILADIYHREDFLGLKIDIQKAYEISNELYSHYVKYDTEK